MSNVFYDDLKEIATMIHQAKRALANGELVDLDGLDDRMAKICSDVEQLPEKDHPSILDKLTLLSESLMSLSANLQERKSQIDQLEQ